MIEEPAGESHRALPRVRVDGALERAGRLAVAPVLEGGLEDRLAVPCEVGTSPDGRVVVSSAVAARVVAWHVEPGDTVIAGGAVVTLESARVVELRTAAASARVDVTELRARLDEEHRMMAGGATSGRALRETQAGLSKARVAFEAALRGLALLHADEQGEGGRFVLRAPVTSIVLSRTGMVGELVSGDVALASLVNEQEIRAVAHLPEGLAVPAPGTHARVSLRGNDAPEESVVTWVAPALDEHARTRKILLAPPATAHWVIGTTGTAFVPIGRAVPGAVRVMRDAVVREGARAWAFVRVSEGEYEPRAITIQHEDDTEVEVIAGLRAGEHVATRGAALIAAERARTEAGP